MALISSNQFKLPSNDEIEVSIFGPGYGESIVIHLLNNNWIVIDSCIDPFTQKCIPLEYLQNLGLTISVDIKQIIATHWHDDHIRGLSKIYREAKEAQFVCSAALTKKEFFTLINLHKNSFQYRSSGIVEFSEIIETNKRRKKENPTYYKAIKLASSEKTLFKTDYYNSITSKKIFVTALSPSDKSIQDSLNEISSFIQVGAERKRLLYKNPNHYSIVIWIDAIDTILLLGSDLENSNDTQTGWLAILDSPLKPDKKASFYKISHHGSGSSDSDRIWEELLLNNPIAGLTPFERGNIFLPSAKDLKRIIPNTSELYTTEIIKRNLPFRRPNIVEKQIREIVGKSMKPIPYSNGHLRFRKRVGCESNWQAETFGNAKKIDTHSYGSS